MGAVSTSASHGETSRASARPVRLRLGPVVWSLAAAFAFLVSFPTRQLTLWHGFLLAVPYMIATVGLGWRAGAALAPVGFALLWIRSALLGSPVEWSDYLGLAAAMLMAGGAGHQLFTLWNAAERRARHSSRRARLLQQAALELHQADGIDRLFGSAPRLLSDMLAFAHAEIFVPDGDELVLHTTWRWNVGPGFRMPLRTVSGRAYRTGEPQYVPDTSVDPEFLAAPSAAPTRSELALPVRCGTEVRAVLNLEHTRRDAFGPHDHDALRAFVRIMEEVLERLEASAALTRQNQEQEFLARLNQRLLEAEGVRPAAKAALHDVMNALGMDAGAVLQLRHARFWGLARVGELPAALATRLAEGFAFDGPLREVWETRTSIVLDDVKSVASWAGAGAAAGDRSAAGEGVTAAAGSAAGEGSAGGDGPATGDGVDADIRSVAIVPVVNAQKEVQALLVAVTFERVRTWSDADRRLLAAAVGSLGVALERVLLARRLVAMLDVVRRLARSDAPATLFHQAAEAAVELVPDAEAASILVREGDLFRFQAAVGYDLAALQRAAGPFTVDEELRWYARPAEDFRRGQPRVLRGSAIVEKSQASSLTRSPLHVEGGRVHEMRAQVLVPITDHGDVVAVLNIDNFSTEDAFGSNAVRVAEAFAQHIAVIVRQAEHVSALERSAITDSLTGLGNRAGFQRRFRAELARAERYRHPLSVVLIDLDNFKAVNDRHGHATGDAALVGVADVLRREQRSSDCGFRWGGDEFVMLLPEIGSEEGRRAALRYAALIGDLTFEGTRLSASVGIATFPDDGHDEDALMQRADGLMYGEKPHPQADAND
jgi:diguanylate cyclase (GGDEF)-like protein